MKESELVSLKKESIYAPFWTKSSSDQVSKGKGNLSQGAGSDLPTALVSNKSAECSSLRMKLSSSLVG